MMQLRGSGPLSAALALDWSDRAPPSRHLVRSCRTSLPTQHDFSQDVARRSLKVGSRVYRWATGIEDSTSRKLSIGGLTFRVHRNASTDGLFRAHLPSISLHQHPVCWPSYFNFESDSCFFWFCSEITKTPL
jgi:hypothetical protein